MAISLVLRSTEPIHSWLFVALLQILWPFNEEMLLLKLIKLSWHAVTLLFFSHETRMDGNATFINE